MMASSVLFIGLVRLLVVLNMIPLALSFTLNIPKSRCALASTADSYGVKQDTAPIPSPPVSPASLPLTSTRTSSTRAPLKEPNESPFVTFREAEIVGLNLMQLGEYEEALKTFEMGMKLEGSRVDILRTKNIQGPSPVGGSHGGTDGKEVRYLDQFEKQAGHYNMACAHARLGNCEKSIENLRAAVVNGFDNIATIKSDPDLRNIQESSDFQAFLQETKKEINKRKGIFGWFS